MTPTPVQPWANTCADSERPTVLLVDDEPVNLALVSAALTQYGFDVTDTSSGEDALHMLSEWVPDLVILDALMPGLDGFETCRRLRARRGLEDLPVLMLTGLDDDASIERAYRAGATDFIVKSSQWSLLAGRLHHMLRAARTHQELVRSRARLARAQDLARMGSFDWRYRPRMPVIQGLEWSAEALHVFGHAADEAMSLHSLLRQMQPDERTALLITLRRVLRHVFPVAMDVPMRRAPGGLRIIHVEAEPEFGDLGQCLGYTGIIQDVTERHLAEDSIRRLANKDSLTQLPNRRQLQWRAEKALEQARRMGHRMALLLIDLDRFKKVNDTLGHTAGDELLIEVAHRLRSCVRHSDQIIDGNIDMAGVRLHRMLEAVGRLGGDEFVALLPEIRQDSDAERVAQRMLHALRAPVPIDGQDLIATASIGVALYPRDGHTVAELMRAADVAMYAAKERGRNNCVTYTPLLSERGREKLELETALYKAIGRQQLILHYQPKIDIHTGAMVGVEALMRWDRGAEGGLVPPGEFIPLAEETGLIVTLSEWALGEAARQAAVWRAQFGFDGAVAVNMPSRMFLRQDLAQLIDKALEPHGIPSHMLVLEITESSLMQDLESILPILQSLNDRGVQISVDDFGTGYSSLQYLTELPISELKVDRSFVENMAVKPKAVEVINLIVSLARSLNLRVVAEGVETLPQASLLRSLDCNIMQGYLFSRPLPGDKLAEWAMTHTPHPRAEGLRRRTPPDADTPVHSAGFLF